MSEERLTVDSSEFVDHAEKWIVEKIKHVLESSDHCHLMLAGGSTPLPVYRALSHRSDIPWSRISLYFGDERCVPVDTPENNAFSVLGALFPEERPQGVTIYRMCGEEDPDKAAKDYESILPERIDILLLGMGADGHTASLFPGSAALDEERRRVMPVIGNKPPMQRLTVTPSVIHQARYLLLMAQGEDKADAVRWALQEGNVPAALARDGDWLLDRLAGRSLL
ncbi:MAG: 6-phosphogluconolactonase [Candidatus Thiodiazotropha sp. 6PLUC2]